MVYFTLKNFCSRTDFNFISGFWSGGKSAVFVLSSIELIYLNFCWQKLTHFYRYFFTYRAQLVFLLQLPWFAGQISNERLVQIKFNKIWFNENGIILMLNSNWINSGYPIWSIDGRSSAPTVVWFTKAFEISRFFSQYWFLICQFIGTL